MTRKLSYDPPHVPPAFQAQQYGQAVPNGGAYVECTVNKERNVNTCTVWNDYTGQAESGDFRLVTENRAATIAELRFRGVAGGFIFLDGNLTLKLQGATTHM